MRAWCLSKRGFTLYCRSKGWHHEENPSEAVISICCNPDVANKVLRDPDPHWFAPGLPNVCNVEFDDITEDECTYTGTELDCYKTVTAYGITPETAERMVRFIDDHRGMDFVVHCRAGRSRSQAVIRYITEFYPEYTETNPDNPCVHPNIHTYLGLRHAREALGL